MSVGCITCAQACWTRPEPAAPLNESQATSACSVDCRLDCCDRRRASLAARTDERGLRVWPYIAPLGRSNATCWKRGPASAANGRFVPTWTRATGRLEPLVIRFGSPNSGRPLTGLCQEAIAFRRNPTVASTFIEAQLPATRLPADSNRIRFLAPLAANRIAPVTHQVQAGRGVLRPPWRLLPPQRNVGAKPCPRG